MRLNTVSRFNWQLHLVSWNTFFLSLVHFPIVVCFLKLDFCEFYTHSGASLVAQRLNRLSPMQETRVRSLSREDPLEKEMVTHSSILAWRIPWTEKPGRLDSIGSQRVESDENIQYPSSLTLRKVMSLHNLTKSPSLFSRRWAQRKLGPADMFKTCFSIHNIS